MSEQRVAKNKVVTFTYHIKDESGAIQEQSDIPMSYLHGGDDRIFPAVMQAMEGKAEGDEVEVVLTPAEGFGEYNPEITYIDKVDNVPPEFRQIGAEAEFRNENGETMNMTVVSMDNGEIKLDGNHPFAGKTMTFKVYIKVIRDAAEEEIRTGKVVTVDGPDLSSMH
ncbi:MAG: peptidylprolyl isomerase [Gammaproteobacteria bacterium]|nr:peptidylprolyl isomerase [Gammaproteobacteria bacterium]